MADSKPLAATEKVAEAQALWEIALLYIALGAAAQTMGGAGSLGNVAAGGARATQLLARAYYRLTRAIFTGYTLTDRGDEDGSRTSLRALYSDFETLAYRSIPKSKQANIRKRVKEAGKNYSGAIEDLFPERESMDDPRYTTDADLIKAARAVTKEDGADYAPKETADTDWSDKDNIVVEQLKQAEAHLEEVEESERRELKELQDRLKAIDKAERNARRDELKQAKRRQLSARKSRARQSATTGRKAGAVMRAAQSGARAEMQSLAQKDQRARGYVRVPHGSNPCGWCLMLASRGPVTYTSKETALAAWHDNCLCTAEPVFSLDYYFTSPAFEKNRALYKMWGDVTKGKKGREAINTWRRHFRRQFDNGHDFTTVLQDNARAHK